MARKRIFGKCHICGRECFLTFEHVPPRAAFNNRRVITVDFNQLIRLGPDEQIKGPEQQGGAGAYTLCNSCNNNTGSWYGNDFVDWCYQSMDILIKTKGKPTLFYMQYMFPLRILKQIISMFMSLNGPGFAKANPELVRFVLDKERKHMSPEYRFFTYYNIEGKFRYVGVSVQATMGDRFSMRPMSELSFPPLGYLMTLKNSGPPDVRLCEITHFARYGYNEFQVMESKLACLPTHLFYPGDYRTREEIELDKIRNEAYSARNPAPKSI